MPSGTSPLSDELFCDLVVGMVRLFSLPERSVLPFTLFTPTRTHFQFRYHARVFLSLLPRIFTYCSASVVVKLHTHTQARDLRDTEMSRTLRLKVVGAVQQCRKNKCLLLTLSLVNCVASCSIASYDLVFHTENIIGLVDVVFGTGETSDQSWSS